MRGSAVFRTGVAPGGVLAGPWVRDDLWRRARAVPSLDLRFADNKSLVDAVTGASLVTFTRASNGTFVGSDGVLQTAVTNLLLRSEEPSNVIWGKDFITVTAAAAIAPNGTTTANKVAEDSSNNFHVLSQYVTGFASGAVVILSIYVKAAGRTRFRIQTDASGGAGTADFDLLAGTATAGVGVFSNGLIINAGNDWYRCSVRCTTSGAGAIGLKVILVQSAYGVAYTGDGTSGLFLWGAQLEQSTTVSEYIPTTSTINSAPRFDHNPTTGESLGLLVEEQRTNSIRNNTMVGAVAGTPGTNPTSWLYATAQSNGLTISVIGTGVENGINYIDYRFNGTTVASPSSCAIGFDNGVAATGQTWTQALYWKLVGGSATGVVNWQIGLIESTSGSAFVAGAFYTQTAPTSAALINQRPTATRTLSGGATVGLCGATLNVPVTGNTAIDFTLRIGLPQLEQGAFATSPILTSTAAATRSADLASITGSAFTGFYRQDEGTVFADVARSPAQANRYPNIVNFSDGTGSNRIQIYGLDYGDRYTHEIVSAGSAQVSFNQSQVLAANTFNKLSLAFRTNDTAFVANTSLILADNLVTLPTVNQLALNGVDSRTIRRLCYWPQRLGNQVLQSITQ